MANHIITRNDTAANWAADNPVLALGEIGIQDGATPMIKVGDGVRTWNQLPYSGSSAVQTTKGDLAGYSTIPARVPVGPDGDVLTADSTQGLGVKWSAPSGTSGQASFMSLEADGPLVLPQTSSTEVSGLYIPRSGGVLNQGGPDLSLVGGTTVRYANPGQYIVNIECYLINAVGTTHCALGYSAATAGPSVLSGYGLSLGLTLPLSAENAVAGSVLHVIPAGACPVNVTYVITPSGGSGNDGLSYYGLDIVRLN